MDWEAVEELKEAIGKIEEEIGVEMFINVIEENASEEEIARKIKKYEELKRKYVEKVGQLEQKSRKEDFAHDKVETSLAKEIEKLKIMKQKAREAKNAEASAKNDEEYDKIMKQKAREAKNAEASAKNEEENDKIMEHKAREVTDADASAKKDVEENDKIMKQKAREAKNAEASAKNEEENDKIIKQKAREVKNAAASAEKEKIKEIDNIAKPKDGKMADENETKNRDCKAKSKATKSGDENVENNKIKDVDDTPQSKHEHREECSDVKLVKTGKIREECDAIDLNKDSKNYSDEKLKGVQVKPEYSDKKSKDKLKIKHERKGKQFDENSKSIHDNKHEHKDKKYSDVKLIKLEKPEEDDGKKSKELIDKLDNLIKVNKVKEDENPKEKKSNLRMKSFKTLSVNCDDKEENLNMNLDEANEKLIEQRNKIEKDSVKIKKLTDQLNAKLGLIQVSQEEATLSESKMMELKEKLINEKQMQDDGAEEHESIQLQLQEAIQEKNNLQKGFNDLKAASSIEPFFVIDEIDAALDDINIGKDEPELTFGPGSVAPLFSSRPKTGLDCSFVFDRGWPRPRGTTGKVTGRPQ